MTEAKALEIAATVTPTGMREMFADDCELRGMSPSTVERYISSIKAFGNYLESKGYNFVMAADRDILRGLPDHLRRDRGFSQKTIENSFTALSSFYEYPEYEGYIDKNSVGSVRKRYIRRYKDLDEGQMRKLISIEDMDDSTHPWISETKPS
jgi:site-specific recombinase XerD